MDFCLFSFLVENKMTLFIRKLIPSKKRELKICSILLSIRSPAAAAGMEAMIKIKRKFNWPERVFLTSLKIFFWKKIRTAVRVPT